MTAKYYRLLGNCAACALALFLALTPAYFLLTATARPAAESELISAEADGAELVLGQPEEIETPPETATEPEEYVYETAIKINDALPEFKIRVTGIIDADTYHPFASYIYRLTELTVTYTETGELLNSFDLRENTWYDGIWSEECKLDFELVDTNFDGYLDIFMLEAVSAPYSFHYFCLQWNPDSGCFVEATEIEDLRLPWFDDEDQTIHSTWHAWAAGHIYETYKYINGVFTLVETLDEEATLFNPSCIIAELLPQLDDTSNLDLVIYEDRKLNIDTGELEIAKEYYRIYGTDEDYYWVQIAEYDASSPEGRRIAETIDAHKSN